MIDLFLCADVQQSRFPPADRLEAQLLLIADRSARILNGCPKCFSANPDDALKLWLSASVWRAVK